MDYEKLVKEVNKRIPDKYRKNPVKDMLFGKKEYATIEHLKSRLKGIIPTEYRVHDLDTDETYWISRVGQMYVPEMLVLINKNKDYKMLAPFLISVFLFDNKDALIFGKMMNLDEYNELNNRAKKALRNKKYPTVNYKWKKILYGKKHHIATQKYMHGEPLKSEEEFAEAITVIFLAAMDSVEYEYWHYPRNEEELIWNNYLRTFHGTSTVKERTNPNRVLFNMIINEGRTKKPKENNRVFYRVETIDEKGVITGGCMGVAMALLSMIGKIDPANIDERKIAMLQGSSIEYDTAFSILAALGCVPKPEVYLKNLDNFCLYSDSFYMFRTYGAFSALDSLMEKVMEGKFRLILKEFKIDNSDILYEDDYQIVISRNAYRKYNDGCSYKYIRDLKPDSTELLPGKKEYKVESTEKDLAENEMEFLVFNGMDLDNLTAFRTSHEHLIGDIETAIGGGGGYTTKTSSWMNRFDCLSNGNRKYVIVPSTIPSYNDIIKATIGKYAILLIEDDKFVPFSDDDIQYFKDNIGSQFSFEARHRKEEETKEQYAKLRLRDSFRLPIMLCGDDTLEILRFLIENCMGELFERLARAVVYDDDETVKGIFDIMIKDSKLKHIESDREHFNVSVTAFFRPAIYFKDLNISKEESISIYRSLCDEDNWLHDAFLSISTKEQREDYMDFLAMQLKDEIKRFSGDS